MVHDRRLVLVMGFGPFLDVADNPAAALARALDGRTMDGVRVVGRVMPVSYRRSAAETLAAAAELGCDRVLGVGVARGRPAAMVERLGHFGDGGRDPDVDGDHGDPRLDGAPVVVGEAEALAAALGVGVSDDAGRYVCNGWIRRVVPVVGRPAAFLHVPGHGFDPERLLRGLVAWAGRPAG